MPLPRRLIVNADDFGLHPAINAAIIGGHHSGIITSASLMSYPETRTAFADAVARLPETPALGIGLHLTLTGVPGLPDGPQAFIRALSAGAFPPSRIESLLRRQLDALLQRGVAIDHVDSHQHLHVLPSVIRVLCRVLPDYGISAVRIPIDDGPYFTSPPSRIAAARMLRVFARRAARETRRSGLFSSQHFRGMAISGHLTPALMRAYIATLPSGVTEILCHPGADNAGLSRSFAWGYDWEEELRAVCDANVLAEIRAQGIHLATYASCLT